MEKGGLTTRMVERVGKGGKKKSDAVGMTKIFLFE